MKIIDIKTCLYYYVSVKKLLVMISIVKKNNKLLKILYIVLLCSVFGISVGMFLMNDASLPEHHVLYWSSLMLTVLSTVISLGDIRIWVSSCLYFFALSIMWLFPISIYWSLIPLFFIGIYHTIIIFEFDSLYLAIFATALFAMAICYFQDKRMMGDYAAAEKTETSISSDYQQRCQS